VTKANLREFLFFLAQVAEETKTVPFDHDFADDRKKGPANQTFHSAKGGAREAKMNDIHQIDKSSRTEALGVDPGSATECCPLPMSPSRKSGPCTPEGIAIARTNAVQHGLSASTLLSEIVPPGRVEFYRRQFTAEIGPQNTIETVLVDEFARHAAMLQFAEQAEGAILRSGAQELFRLLTVCDDGSQADVDGALSAAVASERLDLFTRYRRGHEKAFYAAINAMRDLRTLGSRRLLEPDKHDAFRPHFQSESMCEEYLKKRLQHASWPCPGCGSANGHWLPSRRCWECGRCRRQTGLRIGTVMQGSPIPLLKWFLAIQSLLIDPRTSTAEVGRRIGIDRDATVRRLIKKIRSAIASPDASRSLSE